MALPGLDTDQISFIAYWNFLDNGGSTIDPTECQGVMDAYTEYSNGVEGTVGIGFQNNTNGTAYVRVKDDGWIMAWLDRDETFEQSSSYFNFDAHGTYDIFNDWATDANNSADSINAQQNNLERTVNTLYNQLSNSGAATYNTSDVGIFDYRSDATNLTQLCQAFDFQDTFTIDIPGSTTLYDGVLAAIGMVADDGQVTINGTGYPSSEQEYALTREVVDSGIISTGTTSVNIKLSMATFYLTWS